MPFRALETLDPLRRYLHLKAEVKRLTEEMKGLEPEIWNAVDEEGGAADFEGYALESCVSKTYAYSDAVATAEAEVRAMKDAERKAGVATVTRATGYVRVTERKAADLDASGAPAIDLDALAAEVATPVLDATPF